jgi:hypothetical protein
MKSLNNFKKYLKHYLVKHDTSTHEKTLHGVGNTKLTKPGFQLAYSTKYVLGDGSEIETVKYASQLKISFKSAVVCVTPISVSYKHCQIIWLLMTQTICILLYTPGICSWASGVNQNK